MTPGQHCECCNPKRNYQKLFLDDIEQVQESGFQRFFSKVPSKLFMAESMQVCGGDHQCIGINFQQFNKTITKFIKSMDKTGGTGSHH